MRAVEGAEGLISSVLSKAKFWQLHNNQDLNERQRKVVNRLLDAGKGGFLGGLTTRKYVSMTRTSRVTAYREISDLLENGILVQNPAKGRSVSYDLKW
jgi:Fic family protein